MKQAFDLIEVNPQILLGKPVVRGTRIPVYVIVNLLAVGKTRAYIRKQYPNLTNEDITQALGYAAWTTTITDEALKPSHV